MFWLSHVQHIQETLLRLNYPRTIDLNDYINPLLDGNKLHSHHAFVLGVRNTFDKLRKRLFYFCSVKNHRNPASRNVMYLIILMNEEIELNPGPISNVIPVVLLLVILVISHQWGKDRIVITTNGTYGDADIP
jgi:hypothetical protein